MRRIHIVGSRAVAHAVMVNAQELAQHGIEVVLVEEPPPITRTIAESLHALQAQVVRPLPNDTPAGITFGPQRTRKGKVRRW